MITKVTIEDPKKSPVHHHYKVDTLKEGTEITFTHGVNVIVGKNGCGKTTLLDIIRKIMLVKYETPGYGMFGNNMLDIDRDITGVHVYADYKKATFNYCPVEKQNDSPGTGEELAHLVNSRCLSCGEGNIESLGHLFDVAFGGKVSIYFDYQSEKIKRLWPNYAKYVEEHTVDCDDCWTFILDEPDKNLDIENINTIYNILKMRKKQTQIIAVLHNPVVIYKLMKHKYVNFIELTPGYLESVRQLFNNL